MHINPDWKSWLITIAGCFCFAMSTVAAGNDKSADLPWGIGPFVRDDGADRLGPLVESTFRCPVRNETVHWENKDLLCAAAIVKDGKVYILYRAQDSSRGGGTGTSRIGLAVSEDGRHFKRQPGPVLYPAKDACEKYEWPGGCEDPRVMIAEDGTYVMTYTAWDGKTPRLSVAVSRNLFQWEKKGPAFSRFQDGKYVNMPSKSGSIVCRKNGDQFVATKVKGKYWMYFGEFGAMAATSDNLVDWNIIEGPGGKPLVVLPRRPKLFDMKVTEPGPPAFLTDKGIFLIYNGGSNARTDLGLSGNVSAVGEALFDRNDPTKVIARTESDIFHPERDYEIKHVGSDGNSNVTFVESLVWFNHEWRFYYGCADSWVASAFCSKEIGL